MRRSSPCSAPLQELDSSGGLDHRRVFVTIMGLNIEGLHEPKLGDSMKSRQLTLGVALTFFVSPQCHPLSDSAGFARDVESRAPRKPSSLLAWMLPAGLALRLHLRPSRF